MKKVFLSLVAVLLCGVTFAQTTISIGDTAAFKKIGKVAEYPANGNYILTADLDLGDLGTLNTSIIPTFSGTFDGNGKTIKYQAAFQGVEGTLDYSLFGSVSGKIENLNVNASVSLGGTVNNMNVALICGSLTSSGVIEKCNVSRDVNSEVVPNGRGGSDAGLIVGECAGTVRYCKGEGNVAGVGYVGGLIGQMTGSASVLGCSFSGSVNAASPSNSSGTRYGSFAGGICGFASDNSTLNFCLADASVDGIKVSSGIASTSIYFEGYEVPVIGLPEKLVSFNPPCAPAL